MDKILGKQPKDSQGNKILICYRLIRESRRFVLLGEFDLVFF